MNVRVVKDMSSRTSFENILDDGGDVGDLVKEVKLSLVEVFGRTRQRANDLLHHLLQELSNVRCVPEKYFTYLFLCSSSLSWV